MGHKGGIIPQTVGYSGFGAQKRSLIFINKQELLMCKEKVRLMSVKEITQEIQNKK